MSEVWKDVKGYEGLYVVSSLGRVRGIKRGGVLGNSITRGYKIVTLSKNGVPKTFTVHRVVATAFIPNPENKPEIDHIDTNKLNNLNRYITARLSLYI